MLQRMPWIHEERHPPLERFLDLGAGGVDHVPDVGQDRARERRGLLDVARDPSFACAHRSPSRWVSQPATSAASVNARDSEFTQYRSPLGRGPSSKTMAEMGIAPGTKYFGSTHAMAAVFLRGHIFRGNRMKEARPAGPRVKLVVGDRRAAARNRCRCRPPPVCCRAGCRSGGFGSLATRDPVLGWRQLRLPLGVGLDDSRRLDRADQLTLAIEHLYAHGTPPTQRLAGGDCRGARQSQKIFMTHHRWPSQNSWIELMPRAKGDVSPRRKLA